MNFKIKSNFISLEEQKEIVEYSNHQPIQQEIENEHIKNVNEEIKGWSVLCDFTQTELSKNVSKYQGDSTLVQEVPEIYHVLADRIAESLNISKDHVFFQYIVLGENGKVPSHYDVVFPGYITYKCNICVEGPSMDLVFVDKHQMLITSLDLYCFEANLYRHWMNTCSNRRIHLSYGFLLPYKELNWREDHPRVRMSNRIWKAFIERY